MAPAAATAAARATDRKRRSELEQQGAELDQQGAEFEQARGGQRRQPSRGRGQRDPRRRQRPIGSLRRRVSGSVPTPVGPPPLRDPGVERPSRAAGKRLARPATAPQQPVAEPDEGRPGTRSAPARTKPQRTGSASARTRPAPERTGPAPARTRPAPERARPAPERPTRPEPSSPDRSASPLRATRLARRPSLRPRLDSRWLDRLVRGRIWIPVLAILLVGIVAMRVEVLKLGARAGEATQLAAQLQSTNQQLRGEVAQLGNPARIRGIAARYGMRPAGPLDPHFIRTRGTKKLSQALGAISSPDATAFLSGLQAEQAANGDRQQAVALGVPASSSTGTSATGGSSASGTTTNAGTTAGATSSTSTGGGAAATGSTGTGTSGGSPATGTTGAGITGAAGSSSTGSSATGTASPAPPGTGTAGSTGAGTGTSSTSTSGGVGVGG